MACKIKTLPLGKVWVTPHPSHDYGTYSFLSKQEFCNGFTFWCVDKNTPCFMKTCSVCMCREKTLLLWMSWRKEVCLCERESKQLLLQQGHCFHVYDSYFTVKILNKLKDLATFCVHMLCASVCGGGRGVHTDLDMTYVLCVSCSFFQTCYILVCPNPLCECYIILLCMWMLHHSVLCMWMLMLIKTCPACIYGAVLRMTICSCTT